MLRAWVLMLLLANLVFFAWTQGWIDDFVGTPARGDREPERLNQQVQPELVRILPSLAARGGATQPAPAAALACLEAGPFSGAEAAAAEATVQSALPEGAWASLKSTRPGLWMVYMGKFKGREDLARKQTELRVLRIEYDELRAPPELSPGLSLGRFEDHANAVNALEQFAGRGIRSAKVVEVRAPVSSVMLRVDKASPALAAQVATLSAAALGKGFSPCARLAAN